MGGGAGFGIHGHIIGAGIAHGYPSNWMNDTKQTLENELEDRGLKMERKCDCLPHIIITILLCTIVFIIVWELT
jgi:hypothetical protein